MGGKTPKFTCRTAAGRLIRVKYYDGRPKTGNREVFAEVVAVRLFWALGFPSDIVLPLTVQCLDCPEDPMTGVGPRSTRTLLGVTEPAFRGTPILSTANTDEGWRFGEIDAAITALPPGPDRDRQRMHFDALSLLGAFVQHGDRKPEQQRLVCASDIDATAGDVHALDDRPTGLPALFERPGARACTSSLAMIQDLGATFGSSGKGTLRTAKIDLDPWTRRPVFLAPADDPERAVRGCRADVTPSASLPGQPAHQRGGTTIPRGTPGAPHRRAHPRVVRRRARRVDRDGADLDRTGLGQGVQGTRRLGRRVQVQARAARARALRQGIGAGR
jgi:hypothetical protein